MVLSTWICWNGGQAQAFPIGSAPMGSGADELARLVYGARISLTVGLCAPIIGITIGGALGILAGYFRGRFETLVVGSMDVLLAFPPLILALPGTAYSAQ